MAARHDVTEIEDFHYKIPNNTVSFPIIRKTKCYDKPTIVVNNHEQFQFNWMKIGFSSPQVIERC